MITAQEARKKVTEGQNSACKLRQQYVEKMITGAIEENKTRITLDSDYKTNDFIIKWLESFGYEVKVVYDQRDGDFLDINW